MKPLLKQFENITYGVKRSVALVYMDILNTPTITTEQKIGADEYWASSGMYGPEQADIRLC